MHLHIESDPCILQIPRPVFDGAIQWAMKAERTMFWRGQRRTATKVESPRESIVSMRKVGSVSVPRQTKSEEYVYSYPLPVPSRLNLLF
jgi:hypothetical protein